MLSIRRRTLFLLLTVSLGHVLLISVQVQSKSGLPLIEAASFAAFSKVQQATSGVANGIGSVWGHYFGLIGVSRQNDALRQQMAELEGQLQSAEAIASQTHALEDALKLANSVAVPTLAARVIAGDPSPESLTVTIDRGSDDGVTTDMAVIAAQGVVGRIVNRPGAHVAQLQLLVGRSAGAGAFLERTGAGGVVVGGAGVRSLRMQYVSVLEDVKPGDRVMTSGQDGIFPRGFLIGVVDRADRGSGLYRLTTVRPSVDFSHLDVVLVVLARPAVQPGKSDAPAGRLDAPAGRSEAPLAPGRGAPVAGGRGQS